METKDWPVVKQAKAAAEKQLEFYNQMMGEKKGQHTLELFRSLTKDGAVWHGDVMSHTWGECLYIDDEINRSRVMDTLSRYKKDIDYRIIGDNEIWI